NSLPRPVPCGSSMARAQGCRGLRPRRADGNPHWLVIGLGADASAVLTAATCARTYGGGQADTAGDVPSSASEGSTTHRCESSWYDMGSRCGTSRTGTRAMPTPG